MTPLRKFVAFALICVLAVFCFCSCGEKPFDGITTTGVETTIEDTTSLEETTSVEETTVVDTTVVSETVAE
jgi:hypothetical protein